jgi:hypothetical protein
MINIIRNLIDKTVLNLYFWTVVLAHLIVALYIIKQNLHIENNILEPVLVFMVIVAFYFRHLVFPLLSAPYKTFKLNGKKYHYYGNENIKKVKDRVEMCSEIILFAPPQDENLIKKMGAQFSKEYGAYTIPPIWDITGFARWIGDGSFVYHIKVKPKKRFGLF